MILTKQIQEQEKSQVKKMIKDGWYCCKICGQKIFKVKENACVNGIEYKCKKCKNLIDIKIEPMSLQNK